MGVVAVVGVVGGGLVVGYLLAAVAGYLLGRVVAKRIIRKARKKGRREK